MSVVHNGVAIAPMVELNVSDAFSVDFVGVVGVAFMVEGSGKDL